MKFFSRLLVFVLFFLPLAASLFFLLGESRALWNYPNIFQAYWTDYVISASYLSIKIGFISITLASLIVFIIGYVLYSSKKIKIDRMTSFFIAIPHLAFFSGILFLISTSGFFSRLLFLITGKDLSYVMGWDHDLNGMGLSVSLALKESVFLLFVVAPKIFLESFKKDTLISKSFGHNSFTTWSFVIWPRLFSSLRYPIWMVIAYSISVVDLSIVMAPTNPPPFSIVLWEFFRSSEATNQMFGLLGSFHLIGLLIFIVVGWECLCWFYQRLVRYKLKWSVKSNFKPEFKIFTLIFIVMQILPLLILFLWGLTDEWPFPAVFPAILTFQNFITGVYAIQSHLSNTIVLGLLSSLISIGICLVWLEWDKKAVSPIMTFIILFVPIFPALPLFFGLQIFLEKLNLFSSFTAVLIVHSFLIFPYIFLILKDDFKNFDRRYKFLSRSFSKSIVLFFVKIRIPLMIKTILVAFSVGFAISVSQYLSTIMIGSGRIETLTTEMVVAVSGENRKWMGVYGVLQMTLPLIVFYFTQMQAKKARSIG